MDISVDASTKFHGLQVWLQWPTKIDYLEHSWAVPNNSQSTEASFSPNPVDLLCPQLAWLRYLSKSGRFFLLMTMELTTFPLLRAYALEVLNLERGRGSTWPD